MRGKKLKINKPRSAFNLNQPIGFHLFKFTVSGAGQRLFICA